MRSWDLDTSASQLRHAMEDLQRAWNLVCESWDDSVRRQFSEQFLDPLVPAGKMTLDAANRMRELLNRMENELRQ